MSDRFWRYQHYLFDLDGTVVDSAPGIEASIHAALAAAMPGRQVRGVRECIGPPIAQLLQRLIPGIVPAELQAIIAAYRSHYDREGFRLAHPYAGAEAILERLRDLGRSLLLVTNKPAAVTAALCAHLDLDKRFTVMMSPDSPPGGFAGKGAMLRHLLATTGISAQQSVYVGDTREDWEAASENGLAFLGHERGYGDLRSLPAALRFGSYQEWLPT